MKISSLLSGILIASSVLFVTSCNQAGQTDETAEDTVANEEQAAETPVTADNNVVLQVRESGQYGKYLVDSQGRSLYLFKADSGKNESTCYDDCANAWPPLITSGSPETGDQLDSALTGTIQRKDGRTQVTYGGWPLYYYKEDQNPGDTNGQDVEGFGAEWYLVSPEGNAVHGEKHKE